MTRIDDALEGRAGLNAPGRRLPSRPAPRSLRARTVRIVFSPICSTSNWYSPTVTCAPASGSVSSCSTSRPFSVFGPSVGSCQPSERLSARTVALALTMKRRRFAMHVLVRDGGRIRGELADDLLEDVLERDEALDVAVFVDDEREAAAVALELVELHGERRAFRHEVRLPRARQLYHRSRDNVSRASSCATRFMWMMPMRLSSSPSCNGRRVCGVWRS